MPLIIDNKDITTTTTLDVNNPGKSYLEHKCSSASIEDATQAVDSAQRAFPAWSKTRPAARREILLKAADVFLARKDEFIGYMCEETGAQVPYADFILMLGVNLLRDVAGKVSNIEATSPVLAQEGTSAMVYKQPYGVVLGIAPWYVAIVSDVISSLMHEQECPVYLGHSGGSTSPCSRQHHRPEGLGIISEMLLGYWRGISPSRTSRWLSQCSLCTS